MLPTIKAHFHKIELPVSKRKVEYRAWLKGEDKALLIAREADLAAKAAGVEEGAPDAVANAFGQVVKAVTDGKVDPDSDNYVDVMYVFGLSRARAIGASAQVMIRCNKCPTDMKALEHFPALVNVSDIEIEYPEKASETIEIGESTDGEKIVMKLKQPTYSDVAAATATKQDATMLRACVDRIFTDSTSFSISDVGEEDWNKFLDSLSFEAFDAIEKYLSSQPQASVKARGICPKCKKSIVHKLEGLGSFF